MVKYKTIVKVNAYNTRKVEIIQLLLNKKNQFQKSDKNKKEYFQ